MPFKVEEETAAANPVPVPSKKPGKKPAKDKEPEQAGQVFSPEDRDLDELDGQVIDQLALAAATYKPDLDLSKFRIRTRKEFVMYPGGGFINWTIVFTHLGTQKTLRSDALLMPRNGFWVVLNELDSISR